ncbi:hypothetical protein PMAYCL1PPCAC_09005, partial [Pristionchus mayeri]
LVLHNMISPELPDQPTSPAQISPIWYSDTSTQAGKNAADHANTSISEPPPTIDIPWKLTPRNSLSSEGQHPLVNKPPRSNWHLLKRLFIIFLLLSLVGYCIFLLVEIVMSWSKSLKPEGELVSYDVFLPNLPILSIAD